MRCETRRYVAIFLSLAVLFLLAPHLVAPTIAQERQAGIDARLANVERLLTRSSAAMEIKNGGNSAALDAKSSAEAHFRKAHDLHAAGDDAGANKELDAAVALMMQAVRASDDEEPISTKQNDDYQRRRESVEALALAHERISAEKRAEQRNAELQLDVTSRLRTADQLLEQGKPAPARAALDDTYEIVKNAVESLREGDTLVKELHFSSKEEEYYYEIDRNDTHLMLIQVLLADKAGDDHAQDTAAQFIRSASAMRKQAEAEAGNENYPEAVSLLEQSTKELIRAIRGAGIYIPG